MDKTLSIKSIWDQTKPAQHAIHTHRLPPSLTEEPPLQRQLWRNCYTRFFPLSPAPDETTQCRKAGRPKLSCSGKKAQNPRSHCRAAAMAHTTSTPTPYTLYTRLTRNAGKQAKQASRQTKQASKQAGKQRKQAQHSTARKRWKSEQKCADTYRERALSES